jgi:hypothetical protein
MLLPLLWRWGWGIERSVASRNWLDAAARVPKSASRVSDRLLKDNPAVKSAVFQANELISAVGIGFDFIYHLINNPVSRRRWACRQRAAGRVNAARVLE